MTLIDSNVLMYAAGGEHPHREPSLRLLARIAKGEVQAAVSAEILQEILHRYRSLGHWEQGRELYDAVRESIPFVVSITEEIVDHARVLMEVHRGLSGRDAVHAATVLENRLDSICSYDRDFDMVEGLRRIEPA